MTDLELTEQTQSKVRTIYMTFRGWCLNCGRPVDHLHEDARCDMEGAEERLRFMSLAFEDFLKAERAESLARAVRNYLEWEDSETRQEVQEALKWYRKNLDSL